MAERKATLTPRSSQTERRAPHNIDAERALLGSILLDNSCYSSVECKPEDMFLSSNRLILEMLSKLISNEKPADVFVLSDALKADGTLDRVGGIPYLSSLSDGVPLGDHSFVQSYSRIISENSRRRRQIALFSWATNECLAYSPPEDVALRVQQELSTIGAGISGKFRTVREILLESPGGVEALFQPGNQLTGFPTGILELDHLLCGLQPSELVIVAARPGTGKTAFALQCCVHGALDQQLPSGVFSLEMCRRTLIARMICSEARVDSHAISSGLAKEADFTKLMKAMARLAEAPIWIDDSPNLEIGTLCSRARKLKREKDIKILVIDYLQLISAPGDNRNLQVGFAARALKSLAKELAIPVVVLSQLSRSGERGQRVRPPDLESLRDSGEIEAHADAVIFIHKPKRKDDEDEGAGADRIEFIVKKQRNGPIGTVSAVFVNRFVRFEKAALDTDLSP